MVFFKKFVLYVAALVKRISLEYNMCSFILAFSCLSLGRMCESLGSVIIISEAEMGITN